MTVYPWKKNLSSHCKMWQNLRQNKNHSRAELKEGFSPFQMSQRTFHCGCLCGFIIEYRFLDMCIIHLLCPIYVTIICSSLGSSTRKLSCLSQFPSFTLCFACKKSLALITNIGSDTQVKVAQICDLGLNRKL